MPAATTEQSNPFIKQLASSDRTTRTTALHSLRTYLTRPTPFTALDLLKLWKGLFFSMWMSDKPLTQQNLARDLASLARVVRGRENFLGWIRAFWTTMAREWGGIDALRMDKFLYLVRCYVRVGFEVLREEGDGWGTGEGGLMEAYLGVLREGPLEPRDHRIPNGVRFQVLDVWVEELDGVDGGRTAPVGVLMGGVRALGEETVTKAVRKRVQDALADERLRDWKGEGEGEESGSESESESGDAEMEEGEFAGFD